MPHNITSWHALKLDASNAELVLIGEGFGLEPGAVEVWTDLYGKSYPQVKSWTDTSITVEIPVGVEVIKSCVELPSRINPASGLVQSQHGGQKERVCTNPSKAFRTSSLDVTPDFSAGAVTPSPDSLVISGTNLDVVDEVILFDDDIPSQAYSVSFFEFGGELVVDWPNNFTGGIERLRLVKKPDNAQDTPDQVVEVVGPVGGWSPATPGLVQWVGGSRNASGNILVTITGLDFGVIAGTVNLTSASGTVSASVVSWSETAIVVNASPKTIYTGLQVIDYLGTEADISPSAPIPFKTPGLLATVAGISQSSSNPEVFVITGTNLDHIANGTVDFSSGPVIFYSDEPVFHGTGAAALNTAGGTSSVTITPTSITFEAANDLSADVGQRIVLKDLNGSVNVEADVPDFLVGGYPGSSLASISSIRSLVSGSWAPSDPRQLFLFGSNIGAAVTPGGYVTAVDNDGAGDTKILSTIVQNSTNLVTFEIEEGMRYKNVKAFDKNGAEINHTSGDDFRVVGVPDLSNGGSPMAVTSPSPRVVQIDGVNAHKMGRVSIRFAKAAGPANAYYTMNILNVNWLPGEIRVGYAPGEQGIIDYMLWIYGCTVDSSVPDQLTLTFADSGFGFYNLESGDLLHIVQPTDHTGNISFSGALPALKSVASGGTDTPLAVG